MPEGENPSLIVSDIFHIPKYDTNEVDREQKNIKKYKLDRKKEALLPLKEFKKISYIKIFLFSRQQEFMYYAELIINKNAKKYQSV